MMSKVFEAVQESNHRSKAPEEKRAIAVAAALAIIHAKASNTPADCNVVTDEMNNLSQYADQIQEALKVQ